MRSTIILFFGISLSVFLLIYGLSINGALNEYMKKLNKDCTFEYMYVLKLPIEVSQNKDIEKFTLKNLSIYYKAEKENMNISLEGIKEDTNFFNVHIADNDSNAYISDTVSKKFNIKSGDTITLTDTSKNKIYTLKVGGIVNYASGLTIFMNKKQLNDLLDKPSSYFSGYISNKSLNIDDDYILNVISKENIMDSGKALDDQMSPIVYMVIVISSILFIINMYLLLKLMIDKNTTSISLIKVLGFNKSEINKLYLGSSLYTTIVSSIISIPIAKSIVNLMWPGVTSNLPSYFDIVLLNKHYIFLFIIILSSYFLSISILKKHLHKISLADALKNRE